MAMCPVDGKPCCDDLCYGGECLRGGGEMWHLCNACGKYHDDADEYNLCEAEDDGDYRDEDAADSQVQLTGSAT